MAAQMKAFFDSTGQLWREQKLAGKPAGFFVSTGTQGGGQETTAWTTITQLAHHGMLFIPIGYTFGASMLKMDSIRGGSPYGAEVFAGDSTRGPSETELAIAEHQVLASAFAIGINIFFLLVTLGESRGSLSYITRPAPVDQKLSSLYLLDSIVKKIGKEYIKYFFAHLPKVFREAYAEVHPNMHLAMHRLFNTWSAVFPLAVLLRIEEWL